jgi:hypothetical protein
LKVAKKCRLQAVSRPQKNRTFEKDAAKMAFKLALDIVALRRRAVGLHEIRSHGKRCFAT